MGYAPKRRGKAPTRESFHLGIAKAAYVDGYLSVEEYERSVEHVLRGGALMSSGRIPKDALELVLDDPNLVYAKVTITDSPFCEPMMEVRK